MSKMLRNHLTWLLYVKTEDTKAQEEKSSLPTVACIFREQNQVLGPKPFVGGFN